jgi:hypothetical protein
MHAMSTADTRIETNDQMSRDLAPHSVWLNRTIMAVGIAAFLGVVATAVVWSTSPAVAHSPAAIKSQ